MTQDKTIPAAVLGLSVALGLTAGGYLIGRAVRDVRAADRYVTVKGFAEREVVVEKVRVVTTVQYFLRD